MLFNEVRVFSNQYILNRSIDDKAAPIFALANLYNAAFNCGVKRSVTESVGMPCYKGQHIDQQFNRTQTPYF